MRCFTPRWSCSIRLFRYFDQRSFVSEGSEPSAFTWRICSVRCRTAIQCDGLWRTLLAFNRFAKERLGSRDIASGAQPEVDRPTRPVNRTIEVTPLAADLDVRLIDAP